MQKYSTYKPSNVEWLGDVPSHWKVSEIKHDLEFTTGFTPPTSNAELFNGDITWVTIADMDQKYISTSKTKLTPEAISDAKAQIIPKGSLLYSFKLSIGKVAFAETDLYTNEAIACFLPNVKFNPNFLFYALETYLHNYGKENIYGALLLNRELIKAAKITYPKYYEQTSIAEYLDQATTNIDKVIATKQKQLEKLEQYKQSKIHECVTKGLNPDVALKPSGIDWIGDVPSHWRKIKLRYEIEIQSGEFVSNTELETGGDFPVFGGNGIMGYVSKFNIESERLIIGRVGAKCGNVHYVENPAWISDNALIVATYHNYKYLFYLLTEMNLNSISSQSAQPLITGTKIKNEYVVLPPINEQKKIAFFLNDFTLKISKEKSIIEQQIEKLKQYRKCLIHECVTGKRKVVND
jgi:type I restriction enzyme S subunit